MGSRAFLSVHCGATVSRKSKRSGNTGVRSNLRVWAYTSTRPDWRRARPLEEQTLSPEVEEQPLSPELECQPFFVRLGYRWQPDALRWVQI